MKNKEKHVQLRDVQDVLDIIGGRWRGAIMASLCDNEKRFNELKRDLGSITPTILTKELKFLELNKLIVREVDASSAISVKYKMTKHGNSLIPLIGHIVVWGQNHREIILG